MGTQIKNNTKVISNNQKKKKMITFKNNIKVGTSTSIKHIDIKLFMIRNNNK